MQAVEDYWKVATLDQLLHKLELSEYIAVFAEQQIDLATFMTMSEADLASIGITMFGPRRRLKLGTPLPHINMKCLVI